MNKNTAFTLTEILIALSLIGTLAVLTIPYTANGINKQKLTTQIKGVSVTLQQLLTDQMIQYKANSLSGTSFASSWFNGLNTTKKCDSNICWGTYNNIKGDESAYIPEGTGYLLKNGMAISYVPATASEISAFKDIGSKKDKCMGTFYIDTNAKDKPNILGRDFFILKVTSRGKFVSEKMCYGQTELTGSNLTNACKKSENDSTACYQLLQSKNWVMDY